MSLLRFGYRLPQHGPAARNTSDVTYTRMHGSYRLVRPGWMRTAQRGAQSNKGKTEGVLFIRNAGLCRALTSGLFSCSRSETDSLKG